MAVCLDLLQQLLSSICILDIQVHHQPAGDEMFEKLNLLYSSQVILVALLDSMVAVLYHVLAVHDSV